VQNNKLYLINTSLNLTKSILSFSINT